MEAWFTEIKTAEGASCEASKSQELRVVLLSFVCFVLKDS
jgi:hypothetical protein